MTEKQENLELPKIKFGMASGPEFTLTFKSETHKTQWLTQHKQATLFSDNYLLLEGHLCLVQIEQIEAEPAKPAPRVSASVGKAQSFTIDASGKSTKPY